MKIDKARYETDPEYKKKVDARREKRNEYMKRYMQRIRDRKEVRAENAQPTVIRSVVCLGCAPGACCILNIPCQAGATFVGVHCPCDGDEVTGVVK